MIERIVVASDRSDTAARAVAWAAEMARRYEAQLTIVQAFVPGPPPGEAETELAVYAEQIAGPGTRARVAAGEDPASAIVAAAEAEQADVLVVGNIGMSGRREFLLGNVPNRVSHNATLHGRDSEHGRAAEAEAAAALEPVVSELAGGQLTARAAQIAAVLAKHGLKAVKEDDAARAGPAARGARGARADVLQARPDALDPPRPDSARARRRAREPPGPRAAAERGRGRAGDGGGARRPLGGRVREHRARAAGRRHDRPGAQGPPRGRRPGGGQGPATERRGRDRARSRPVRALRREGRGARGPSAAWSTSRPLSSISRHRSAASSTSARRRRTSSGCARCWLGTRGWPCPGCTPSSRAGGCSSWTRSSASRCARRLPATSAARPPGSCWRPSTARC